MPELNGVETCKLIHEAYDSAMVQNDLDTPAQAHARTQIFKPEMVCCSAYDHHMIAKSLKEVGIVHILSKPPRYNDIREVMNIF